VELLDGIWADDSRMGHVAHGEMKPLNTSDIFLADASEALFKIQPNDRFSLHFDLSDQIVSIGDAKSTLEPFYKVHEARYQMYWPVVQKAEDIPARRAGLSEKDEVFLQLTALTVDEIALGEQQPESDHFYKSGRTRSGNVDGFFWRSPEDWMSYQLRNDDKKARKLQLTYIPDEADAKVNIFMNGQLLTEEEINKTSDKAPFVKSYSLRSALIDERQMEIRFEAVSGHPAPKISHIRLLKEKE